MNGTGCIVRNNVQVSGVGERVMMFAHGFGCDQGMWRLVAPAFEATHRVVLFDYVGSGQSDITAYDSRRYGSLEGYARDVVEICESLEARDVCFVGHSVSGMIGMLAAIQRPDFFSSLIMLGPSPCYINDGSTGYMGGFERGDLLGLLELMDSNRLSWANFLAGTVMQNKDRPELAQALEASFCATDPKVIRQFAEVTFFSDHRADLTRCGTPSLIVQVAQDAIAPVAVGNFLHSQLAHSTLRHLDASGHCPHVSHPEETIAAIQAYLGDHRPE